MRKILVMAAALAAAAATAAAAGRVDPFAGAPGLVIGADEAAAIAGGDVTVELNDARDTLKVKIEYTETSPQGRPLLREFQYEVPAHNRVVDTTRAEFMTAGGAKPAELKDKAGLTSKPATFPVGTHEITEVKKRDDRFGPNIIKTNAVGTVDVYDSKWKRLGSYKDEGYAIHSNDKDFDKSQSWGCIIVQKKDNEKLAKDLRADKARKGKQTVTVVKQKIARKTGSNY